MELRWHHCLYLNNYSTWFEYFQTHWWKWNIFQKTENSSFDVLSLFLIRCLAIKTCLHIISCLNQVHWLKLWIYHDYSPTGRAITLIYWMDKLENKFTAEGGGGGWVNRKNTNTVGELWWSHWLNLLLGVISGPPPILLGCK